MPTAAQEPTLLFFRKSPNEWQASAELASSLQSVETSFFLTALGRHPHALSVIASAIESCLQAGGIGAKNDGLQERIKKAKHVVRAIQVFPDEDLERLRNVRNRIVHRGFSPKDDSESVSIYISIALPLLQLCYENLHSFDFMGGLLNEYAEHIAAAQKVHAIVRETPDLDLTYCLRAFSHRIRWGFKENFSSSWEIGELIRAEETGTKFERTYEQRKRLKALFDAAWNFRCPTCDEFDSAVGELDTDRMDRHEIVVNRLACTNCGFVVYQDQPYLSQVLLERQVIEAAPEILKEYGIV